MAFIKVDSRGCGAGKTHTTIIPRMKYNNSLGLKTLLVVPSIKLQYEYAKVLGSELTIINSEGKGGIMTQYNSAADHSNMICLTHQGFLSIPHTTYLKNNVDLIIDEALTPYDMQSITLVDQKNNRWASLAGVISWVDEFAQLLTAKPRTTPQPFFEVKFKNVDAPSIINNTIWQRLCNPNWLTYTTWETGNNLMNDTVQTAGLMSQLNPKLLSNWSSVWIAAAAFEKTFMSAWMHTNNLAFEVVKPFVAHQVRVDFHMPCETFRWSKACRDSNPDIESSFSNYVYQHRQGRLIYNSNNDSKTAFMFADRITHNAHGINEYSDRTDYAFATAIQLNATYTNFIKQFTGMSSDDISFALSGYMAYQLIMRTALRDSANEKSVQVFVLDTQMILGVLDLFDPHLYETHADIPVKDLRGQTRKDQRQSPLTATERSRIHRQKKKLKGL